MPSEDPCSWSLAQARDALDGRRISAVEYADALEARARTVQALNAVAYRDPAGIRAVAGRADAAAAGAGQPDATAVDVASADEMVAGSGRLRGIPLIVKDMIDVADAPTTAGTGALAGRIPAGDAALVRSLRAAGTIVAGKATMHELAFGITCNNAVTGAVRNPYDPEMIPGGSSGGTAVAVAAGVVPAGLGGDTGGSVRLPAALCGLVGFRPTVGRYPSEGTVVLSRSRDTIGPITRCVADARLLDAVLAGTDMDERPARLAGTRLGVPSAFYADLEPAVERAVRRVLDLLADAGATLVEVSIDDVLEPASAASLVLVMYEMRQGLRRYLDANGHRIGLDEVRAGIGSPDVAALWDSSEGDRAVTDAEYRQALADRDLARTRYADVLRRHGLAALVQPTAPLTARPIGQDATVELNGQQVPTFATFTRHTDLAGALALPGISLPCGLSAAGLPVGVEIGGVAGQDGALLALAAAIEPLLPPTPPPQLTP